MPILMPKDTRNVLREGAGKCDNRSLLHRKLAFFDESIPESRRVALDLIVDQGTEDLLRIDRECDDTLHNPKKTQRHQDIARELQETISPLLVGRARPQLRVPGKAWKERLPKACSFELVTVDRLLLGLAEGVIENAGIYLHRFFGVPYIPGSSLKGIARDAAVELEIPLEIQELMFGRVSTDDEKALGGVIHFLPAFPVKADCGIVMEIATPHYRDYYKADGDNPNALENEGPNPLVFPAVADGERFRFDLIIGRSARGLSAESQELLRKCLQEGERALRHALCHHGVGAKTASGFGRFQDPENRGVTSVGTDFFSDLAGISDDPLERLEQKHLGKVNSFSIARVLTDLLALEKDEDLRKVATKIIPQKEWDAFKKKNPFWAKIRSSDQGRKFLSRFGKELE